MPPRASAAWKALVSLGMNSNLLHELSSGIAPGKVTELVLKSGRPRTYSTHSRVEWKKIQLGWIMGRKEPISLDLKPLVAGFLFEWAGFGFSWCAHGKHWYFGDDFRQTDCPEHSRAGEMARYRSRKRKKDQEKAHQATLHANSREMIARR